MVIDSISSICIPFMRSVFLSKMCLYFMYICELIVFVTYFLSHILLSAHINPILECLSLRVCHSEDWS